MPGVFGGSGDRIGEARQLRGAFEDIWGSVEWEEGGNGAGLGGHSFVGGVLARGPDGALLARDGEGSTFRATSGPGTDGPRVGNVVQVLQDGSVRLEADEAGLFPLYFAASTRGCVFSSLLRPLARSVGASPDPVGIGQFLRYAYTCAGRTVFREVRRVRPGERVEWRRGRGLELSDGGELWTPGHDEPTSVEEAAEEAGPLLREALGSVLSQAGRNVLMMSPGWDSRTLLAAARSMPGLDRSLSAFSHGDSASRELRLARRLCERLGVPWRARPIGSDVWDPDHLERTFRRAECLVFPHWARAGAENTGASCLFSGVLGEVLGGHYGRTHLAHGFGKVTRLLRDLQQGEGDGWDDRGTALAEARSLLRLEAVGRPWYLADAVEDPAPELLARFNEDVDRDLDRLAARGVGSVARLVEAFVTEHRGVQYIGAQVLSARSEVDVVTPFAEPDLLSFASRIPERLKVHNRVNRALSRRLAPELRGIPTAAILTPVSWPLLLQEASRVVRRVYEDARWSGYLRTAGRVPRPRLGWVDFEFLRRNSVLADVVDGLTADLWDREALESMVEAVNGFTYEGRLHPLFDQLGKIMTVDRWLA